MRLNRLEIAGFKSFPDRAELTFDNGVTAIVGPNGCGKSNVVDALTWVLGEQSAKSLRGDRMEDVIFGGSDARKPTAAAEVRLRLSGVAVRAPERPAMVSSGQGNGGGNGNGHGHGDGHLPGVTQAGVQHRVSDAAAPAAVALADDEPLLVRDVELMRRLYRSGESEYLIDGEICRLRDIQDLLMDAGLGVKAYAVIEQGKIGQILSARPTDRRQLIEEAAGVTKYKSRRRAAELKLEAAQQNLTRVDDIVFEVEKQRGALKRQAAKARRYKRLREELRRWEKVQFAARYRLLAQAIESGRARLADARTRETAAAAHLAGLEATLERLRIELTDADGRSTAAREAAHGAELEVGRLQQQIAFDRQQIEQAGIAASSLQEEVQALEARREPTRLELEDRRNAAAQATLERDEATRTLASEEIASAEARRQVEGLEADVEAARSELYAAVNAATALRHALEHARAAQSRMVEQIARLDVESADLRLEAERASRDRAAADEALHRARQAMEALRIERATREGELAGAREARDARARDLRSQEHELAALTARLRSLQELDAARAEYGDGARAVLAEPHPDVPHLGSVADHLEVEKGFERAVEACLGERLQFVVVASAAHAAAGLRFAADRNAGRVGFVVADPDAAGDDVQVAELPEGVRPLSELVRVAGPARSSIGALLSQAGLASGFEAASAASVRFAGPLVTPEGEVFHGPRIVEGGLRAEARGILATKREIRELSERVEAQAQTADRLRRDTLDLDVTIASVESAITALQAELHRQEKAAVGFELQAAAAADAAERVARKQDQIAVERRSADEEQRSQEARQEEALASIRRIEVEQRHADEQLNLTQRRLFEARESSQLQANRTAEAKAVHAALVERSGALGADVKRLEAAAAELESRIDARHEDLRRTAVRRAELERGVAESEAALDVGVKRFGELREAVRQADERAQDLRAGFDDEDARIREARRGLESVRSEVAQLDVARATAESDLSHLAAACADTVQATLDEVMAEVDQLERDGVLASPRPVDEALESAETGENIESEGGDAPSAAEVAPPAGDSGRPGPMTADEMVADLRARIERMGAVNMMAIDQFDDLESRHTFLTAQRRDLVDSIAATGEAIRRIDKTTKERFRDAFTVINQNFEHTFTTLFGGGRAGLVLLDEADQLESGIDIIAQPPGKRLQNVQLLSGGEKALTAMALMFAIFKYRPSPFCLLDEIDAPLDDANIGRFVEMLQGMQDRTQFILITHNRKTMEIADRLYGITMEEPGVSKLISVRLN
ncbi:MAG TPA: chromosome segregation protein SMC [Vicinamibacterales bacterium]|nr:chromosome segregation protein SMC [Vicinamibacterales bacterium]